MKIDFDLPKSALEKWNPNLSVRQANNSINIFDSIGENFEGTGITAKLVSSVLRKADGDDVTVNINSPGGSFFEGIAIYNLLKEYEGSVKVKVIGLAASAASLVALAGDEIEIAESGFMMIHDTWLVAIGNKQDMLDVADTLSKFDESAADIYSAKSGKDKDEIKSLMAKETWFNGRETVDMGFADSVMNEDVEEEEDKGYNASLRIVDRELAKAGMPRGKRRDLIKDLTSGTPSAADPAKPGAGDSSDEVISALSDLLTTLKKDY